MPLKLSRIMEKVPSACKNHKSNGQAKIEEPAIIIFLLILSARYPPIKPPILPLIRKVDMAIPLSCMVSPLSVKRIDMKLIKLVITTERVNIIENIIHNGRDFLTKSILKSDRLVLLLLPWKPGKILININDRITPGKDNSHNLLNPPDDTIDVIINGAPASPIHPTIRNIDIINVELVLS